MIALGSFFSPARLVNDCEYTADRALSKGSSDGAMPAGSTKGSKLRSVAALVSSLRNVAVPQDMLVLGEVGLAGEVRARGCLISQYHRGSECTCARTSLASQCRAQSESMVSSWPIEA